MDDRENSLYQYCAAAPIRNHNGDVIAAISCVGLYEKFIDLSDLGNIVKETALTISKSLGYKEE
ncbi:IclR family transcriptional regulator C-terminal domain-containing protein [Allocoprobacillus halotolerans]|uniref:IclR family transcriptional regulator C-terminal domain-containing protein n=1 Tax=Allocoprobacillus halotolerans TaxID=2944914 RepID=A0ABY5IA29_9FIRM|nr:IclR family transcriptional regulator C-terminal domain-containing protein [Allocoprobacillus halotolerans]UTY40800.1 IclR family transcriptional regulator C-terminal domain-containing protein [Allocoprobacillus halotolerans]